MNKASDNIFGIYLCQILDNREVGVLGQLRVGKHGTLLLQGSMSEKSKVKSSSHLPKRPLAVSRYPHPASHILPVGGKGISSSQKRAAIAKIARSRSGVTSCVGSGLGNRGLFGWDSRLVLLGAVRGK